MAAAFDFMSPAGVADAFRAHEIHPRIGAAIMRESVNVTMEARFAGTRPSGKPIPWNKSERTGSVEAAEKWNLVLREALGPLVEE